MQEQLSGKYQKGYNSAIINKLNSELHRLGAPHVLAADIGDLDAFIEEVRQTQASPPNSNILGITCLLSLQDGVQSGVSATQLWPLFRHPKKCQFECSLSESI